MHLMDAATLDKPVALGQLRLSVNDTAFSKDGRRLVTASTGTEAVQIWDLEAHRDLLTLPIDGLLYTVVFSPGDEYIGAHDSQERFHVWRAPAWDEIAEAEAGSKTK